MYAQVLIAASLLAATFQDIRERAVSDLVWIPAVAGAALVFAWSYPSLELQQLVKVALIGGIAGAFAIFGSIGEADAIAMAAVACDPFPLSPIYPLVAAAFVAIGHIGYEFAVGEARGSLTIPVERFLREQKWIPKAIVLGGTREEVSADVNVAREEVEAKQTPGALVEVSYGVPTVAYLGVGYALFLVYLFIFQRPWFLKF